MGRLPGLDHSQDRIIREIKRVSLDTSGGYTNQKRHLLTDSNAQTKKPQVLKPCVKLEQLYPQPMIEMGYWKGESSTRQSQRKKGLKVWKTVGGNLADQVVLSL